MAVKRGGETPDKVKKAVQHRRPRTRHDKTRRELGRAAHMATPSHTFCARRCARPTVDACTPAGACCGQGMGWVDGCTVVADCITRSNNYYCSASELRAWCVSQFLLSAELCCQRPACLAQTLSAALTRLIDISSSCRCPYPGMAAGRRMPPRLQ